MIRAIIYFLLAIHALLIIWALIGFVEWFSETTPWQRVSNPLFPRHIMFMQWTLTLAAGVIFIGGYVVKWRHTPVAMVGVYAGMATLCAVETFGYMKGDLRFVAMGLEYLAYTAILMFLFRSNLFISSYDEGTAA